jgi:gamma-glutamyltranspeptidase/glutathione hydrolase
MSLAEVVQPARELAAEHQINEQQGVFLKLLYPIMTLKPQGRELYEPNGVYKSAGDILRNPLCVEFLDMVAEDRAESFYLGEISAAIDDDMKAGGGWLTREDLARYQVVERKPLHVPYREYTLLTSPSPSVGGTLIALSIALLEKAGTMAGPWGEGSQLLQTVTLMQEVEKIRDLGVTTPSTLEDFLNSGQAVLQAAAALRTFSRGTTHISIADRFGNCAAMTCSNGEGSGYYAPRTGVMLNNMMGEDDLHPEGFHSSPPGQRVGSMMSPSLLAQDGEICLVIGSGGSKRIRTAVSQVMSQIVDFNRPLKTAVEAPRLYWDGQVLQVEPGFTEAALKRLAGRWDLNVWSRKYVFFGGVHAVIPGREGAGDSRRGGSVREV